MPDAGHQGGWGAGAITAPNPFNVATPPPIGNPFGKPPNPFLQDKENNTQAPPSNPFSALAAAPNPFASAPSASLERWASLPADQATKTSITTRNPFETTKPESSAANPQAPKPSTSVHSRSSPGVSTNGSRKVAEFVQPAWPGESNNSRTSVVASKANNQNGGLGTQNNRHNGRSSQVPTAAAGKQASGNKFGLPASSRTPNHSANTHDGRSRELAIRIQQQLAQDRIKPPKWPANPGSHAQRQAMEAFRESYKAYREKARKSLIKAGLIDDPDQRRTLQQALDFRGISDEMCPEWEKITRIIEYDIRNPEKAADESGDLVATPSLMVKRLARSAAGQDAPLPMDVRSFATLRKTLDYLVDDLIPEDSFLPSKHNYLWDRTRAIRIDLSVQKYNLTPDERTDLIYCLETIARFHVVALHLLSQEGFAADDFSEQQEVEQLGKTLISLKELYDDCIEQNIECPNEAEFRGYYIVFNARNPSIKEAVEGWPARLWNNDGIRTAMCLVEALQNTWSLQGPLNPYAPTELALSASEIFFSIVASPQISYTMACFAEIHFNDVRKSMLQILRKSYTRPREGPKDITPAFLKARMRFDTEDEAVDFAQKHGIVFGQDGHHRYAILNSRQSIEDPRIRHAFSRDIVERKRSGRALPEVIHETVFDSCLEEVVSTSSQESGLFITDKDPGISSDTSNGVVRDGAAKSPGPTRPSSSTVTMDSQLSNGTAFTRSQVPAAPNAGPDKSTGIPKVSTPMGPFATTSSSTHEPNSQTTSNFMKPPHISPIASNPGLTNNHQQASQLEANTATPIQTKIGGGTVGTGVGASTPSNSGESAPKSLFSFLEQSNASSGTGISTQAESEVPIAGPTLGVSPKPSLFSDLSAGSKQPTTATAKPPTSASSSLFASSDLKSPLSGGRLLFAPEPSVAAKDNVGSLFETKPPNVPPKPGLKSSPPGQGSKSTKTTSRNALPPMYSRSAFESSSTPHSTPSAIISKRPPMEEFTRWYVLADKGLMEEELEALAVENVLRATWEDFQAAEEARVKQEEDEKSWAEALQFRRYSLKVTFFYRWREIARKRRVIKRIQLEKEKARKWKSPENVAEREAAEAFKQERAIQEAKDLVGKRTKEQKQEMTRLRQSTQSTQFPQSLEDALLATGVFSGVRDERAAAHRAVGEDDLDTKSDMLPAERLRLRSENQRRRKRGLPPLKRFSETQAPKEGSKTAMLRALSSGNGRDTLSMSTGSLRNSTFSSSYRSSLGFNQSRVSKSRQSISDPYWRMKANGLVQMPNGEYLHESLALPMLEEGKRYPGLGNYGLPPKPTTTPSASPPAGLIAATSASSPIAANLFESDRSGRSPSVMDAITQKRKRGYAEDDDLTAYRRETPLGHKRAKSRDPSSSADPSSEQELLNSIDDLLSKVNAVTKSSVL